MTVEEKAKAYDEALERARAINNGKDVDVEAGTTICEYIFPELAESDDEKIRKDLIEYLKVDMGCIPSQFESFYKKSIAWLEKQGAQKPETWCAEDEQNLNVVLSFIPDECLRRWLKDKLCYDMKDAGYEWDGEKKELKKIETHYDIKNFHAGMPVLVRIFDNHKWCYLLFSHCYKHHGILQFSCGGAGWTQCIPFEGNEHLLGTTDMCDERFINW